MEKTGLKIRVYGDRILKKRALSVKEITKRHAEVLSSMAQTMYETGGIGLAAPQVGISERLVVIDIGQGLYKLINPCVTKKEGKQSLEEGCLSVPEVSIKVQRAKKVVVRAMDETGKPLTLQAEGLLACVFQHEIDHLNGKLIVDYASFLDKIRIAQKLAELKERSNDGDLPKPKTKPRKL
jgi:peptide deformylase